MGTGSDARYTREQAWQLLTEWTASESLRKHALSVEACVLSYGEAEADRLGLGGLERAPCSSSTPPRPCCTTTTMSATPRPTSIPSLAYGNWSGWLARGAADRHPRPRTVLRSAARLAPGQGAVCL